MRGKLSNGPLFCHMFNRNQNIFLVKLLNIIGLLLASPNNNRRKLVCDIYLVLSEKACVELYLCIMCIYACTSTHILVVQSCIDFSGQRQDETFHLWNVFPLLLVIELGVKHTIS